ncbi:fungal-specific transcription factor domain-containing protein [Aspergillus cavernicola]|uniref:Fungal-specific transcription factor domain-containing protein n=1 Tax=Aspergillus cavernicola TaxID=176166 RepID=A0ABR4IAV4_9EURO
MTTVQQSTKKRQGTMACASCRESKVKCTGGLPACSNCVSRNRECRYQVFDKRKLPLRVAIELLSYRVDQLCQFIHQSGHQPPPMPEEKDAALRKIVDTLGIAEPGIRSMHHSKARPQDPATHVKVSVPSSATFAIGTLSDGSGIASQKPATSVPDTRPGNESQLHDVSTLPSATHNRSFVSALEDVPSVPLEGNPGLLGPAYSDNDPILIEEQANPSEIEGLIDEISDRISTLKIGPGGKTRLYGSTSTFNLTDGPLSLDNYEIQHRMRTYHFGPDEEIPAAFENHLINLYFSWQDPSLHVVDREIYEEARTKWINMEETPFYSEALRNAMCALGSAFESRFHPTFVTFPKTLVDFFGDRAKLFLDLELDCPCVATVQAMVLLSSHEIGNGKEERGWLYSGMALRLAFDLALHLEMSSYVSDGVISAADADLRRTVFWTAYIVDHQVGFQLGRPFRTNMEDVTVSRPQGNADHWRNRGWVPYELSMSVAHGPGLLDCMEAICQQLVSLCELMAPCGYILYGTSSISKNVLQELNAKIVAELCKWKAMLPPICQISLDDVTSPYLPHVLMLHMQYHQNIIYAHRPWMSKSHLQPQPPKGPGYTHARGMCIQSAIAISKILNMYDTRYTLRRINVTAVSITSSAVLLLLFAAVSNYPSQSKADIALHLNTCFRALDEFTVSWQSAQRAKDMLLSLQRQWEIRIRSSKLARRSEGAIYAPGENSKVSNELHQMSSVSHDPTMQMDFDLDRMLRTEGEVLSGGYHQDLF